MIIAADTIRNFGNVKAGDRSRFLTVRLPSLRNRRGRARKRPDAQPNDKMQFRFHIAINEPEVCPTQPLIELSDRLVQFVEGIVAHFKPLLE
jgi:hypothetical protein